MKRNVYPRPNIQNGTWEHYKGGRYDVYGLSQDEATGHWYVLYRNIQSGQCFHRPAVEWEQYIDTGRRRFTLVPVT